MLTECVDVEEMLQLLKLEFCIAEIRQLKPRNWQCGDGVLTASFCC